MAGHAGEHAADYHEPHIVPVGVYVAVFVALMLFTGLTTGIAYIDLGAWNTVVALAIAVCKMLLVVLFFMHVKYATGLTRIVIIGAFFWLGIMITLTGADEFTRHLEIVPQDWHSGMQVVRQLF